MGLTDLNIIKEITIILPTNEVQIKYERTITDEDSNIIACLNHYEIYNQSMKQQLINDFPPISNFITELGW